MDNKEFFDIFQPYRDRIRKLETAPTLPFTMGPLEYAGLGSFVPELPDFDLNMFDLQPTEPTAKIQTVRDLITGEITGYADEAIPETEITESINAEDLELWLNALQTGVDLLTTTEKLERNDPLPNLVREEEEENGVEKAAEEEAEAVAILDNWDVRNFEKEVPNPVVKFNFELDPFQLKAIMRLEHGDNVFVSAPTSAGKTVIAQYAIALCKASDRVAIYTSPIKALSNQKYREFTKLFGVGQVGILTGDITLQRDAQILIMTTEVLRGMLYQSDARLREVGFVVFDECHYIADPERGHVWEECIMTMPSHIRMVFLSATVPNDVHVASWVARIKKCPVYIERHETRPVPLIQYVWDSDTDTFTQLTDDNGTIVDSAFTAIPKVRQKKDKSGKHQRKQFPQKQCAALIKQLSERSLLPVLMFAFAQNGIEMMAGSLKKVAGSLNLLTEDEQARVRSLMSGWWSLLSEEDRRLPQTRLVRDLAYNGIGMHHGGMLIPLKEATEILLAEGLMKVLFCTSTFAMGINVPAKTCFFTQSSKFNGQVSVPMTATEYAQMSGRAGRRGLDTSGHSILFLDDNLSDVRFLRSLVCGGHETLESKFDINVNMLLSLKISGESIEPINFFKRSLLADDTEADIDEAKRRINEDRKWLETQQIDCTVQDIEDATSFHSLAAEMKEIIEEMIKVVTQTVFLKAISTCKVVFVMGDVWDLAEICSMKGKRITVDTFERRVIIRPQDIGAVFSKGSIEQIRSRRSEPTPFAKILGKKSAGVDLVTMSNRLKEIYNEMAKSPCFTCPQKSQHVQLAREKSFHAKRLETDRAQVDKQYAEHIEIIQNYERFVQSLGYVDGNGNITPKGRVCLKVKAHASQILATELLFANFFNGIRKEDLPVVTSMFVCDRLALKIRHDTLNYTGHLAEYVDEARRIGQSCLSRMQDFDIVTQEKWLEENVCPGIMDAVYLWCRGDSLGQSLHETSDELKPGLFVRILKDTAHLLKHLHEACLLIGKRDLASDFKESIGLIDRGIVLVSSLYLLEEK